MNNTTQMNIAFLIPLVAQPSLFNGNAPKVNLQKLSNQKLIAGKGLKLEAFLLSHPKTYAATFKNSAILKWCSVVIVLLGHMLVAFMLLAKQHEEPLLKPATPITVSIIAPPAPEVKPEVVPLVAPVKVTKKPIVKLKKVVEKIVPVENPMQPLFEATTEPAEEKVIAVEEVAAPVVVADKAAPKSAPVEEKMELPKFGVAYLNNPAPDYPKISKRAGEEGRVLLKVLVNAKGDAENVEIEKSSRFDRLDQAAINAVQRWRFIPAHKGEQALSAFVLVPVNFSLSN